MAYERAWASSFKNLYVPQTALDQTRYQLWSLKALLCGHLGGLTLGLWSVYSSSDSVTAGNGDGPGVDRWLSSFGTGSQIVRGGGAAAKSWVVLKSPTALTPVGVSFYLSIVFDGGLDYQASFYMSKAAPAGGTTTARPTAADEWGLHTPQPNNVNNAGILPCVITLNLLLTNTGDFVFFTTRLGTNTYSPIDFFVMAINPVGTHVSDLFPLFTAKFTGSGAFVSNGVLTTGFPARNSAGVASSNLLQYQNVGLYPTPDILTNKYIQLPAFVISNISAVSWHLRGRLPDIMGIPSPTLGTFPSGNVIREAGAATFVSVGGLWLPTPGGTLPNFA